VDCPLIFLSYRVNDSLEMVSRLDADLSRLLGPTSLFRDKSRLMGGCNWNEILERNARGCRVMLVVIGTGWQAAAFTDGDWKGVPRLWHPEDWVRREINLALEARRVVLPLLLNQTPPPAEG
jgi:hypothetical protein